MLRDDIARAIEAEDANARSFALADAALHALANSEDAVERVARTLYENNRPEGYNLYWDRPPLLQEQFKAPIRENARDVLARLSDE